jgi:hypothetical protein
MKSSPNLQTNQAFPGIIYEGLTFSRKARQCGMPMYRCVIDAPYTQHADEIGRKILMLAGLPTVVGTITMFSLTGSPPEQREGGLATQVFWVLLFKAPRSILRIHRMTTARRMGPTMKQLSRPCPKVPHIPPLLFPLPAPHLNHLPQLQPKLLLYLPSPVLYSQSRPLPQLVSRPRYLLLSPPVPFLPNAGCRL